MFYEFDLTIPANTAKASPAELEVPLNAGTVTRVEVQFPAGCSGLVSVVIRRSGHQVWPGDPDEDIAGEDALVWWPESYDLDDQPFGFVLRGWSPTTTYQHIITFRFALLPLAEVQAARAAPGLISRLSRIILGGS